MVRFLHGAVVFSCDIVRRDIVRVRSCLISSPGMQTWLMTAFVAEILHRSYSWWFYRPTASGESAKVGLEAPLYRDALSSREYHPTIVA